MKSRIGYAAGAVLMAASLACSSEHSKPQRQAPLEEPPRAAQVHIQSPAPQRTKQISIPPINTQTPIPAGRPAVRPAVQMTCAQALQKLRDSGYETAAGVLEARVNQEKPKMKLTEEEARQVSTYLVEELPNLPKCAALLDKMPKAAVELVRGTRERGMSSEAVEEIALYLSNFLGRMRLGNAGRFDESVSHVIGRTYEQIDWSGEDTSAEQQRRDWEPYGVPDFRTAEHYHNYLRHAVEMRWFTRAFQPRGRLPADFDVVLHSEAQ